MEEENTSPNFRERHPRPEQKLFGRGGHHVMRDMAIDTERTVRWHLDRLVVEHTTGWKNAADVTQVQETACALAPTYAEALQGVFQEPLPCNQQELAARFTASKDLLKATLAKPERGLKESQVSDLVKAFGLLCERLTASIKMAPDIAGERMH